MAWLYYLLLWLQGANMYVNSATVYFFMNWKVKNSHTKLIVLKYLPFYESLNIRPNSLDNRYHAKLLCNVKQVVFLI